MNQVSDLHLALAVYGAGCLPSLLSYCHEDFSDPTRRGKFNARDFVNEVVQFNTITGSALIWLCIDLEHWFDPVVQTGLEQCKFQYVTLYKSSKTDIDLALRLRQQAMAQLSERDCSAIGLVHEPEQDLEPTDFWVVKGQQGAGRSSGYDTRYLFDHYSQRYGQRYFIPAGGIACAEHVTSYIESGAWAVALGTLFALAEESRLDNQLKQQIIAKQIPQLQHQFSGSDQYHTHISYGNFDEPDDINRTRSLIAGLSQTGRGHIYLGQGIDHVYSIRSVQEIVDTLVSGV